MGNSKSLPATMIALAYGSAGAAVLCSYFMLRQMMEQGGVQVGGDVITKLWPFVVLGSSFTLARMAGHLWSRRMFGALALIAGGFLFLESISVGTSYYSALHALELKQQAELANATGAEATEQATMAAASLAGNLEAVNPANTELLTGSVSSELDPTLTTTPVKTDDSGRVPTERH